MKHAKLNLRARSASLLAILILTLLPGCGNESRPSRPGTAGLQIHLLFPDKIAAGTAGVAGTTSVQTIRVSAWEVPGGEAPWILRDSTTALIAPDSTRFRLELQIPPAALYLLQVEAEGILGSPPNATGNGLLFLGSENIADVVAGETRPVEIALRRAVPALQGKVVPTGLSLSWGQVVGAVGYRLLETLPPPSLPRETFTPQTDTLIVFPPRAKTEAPEQRTYRVRAELPDGLFSAYSESVGVSVPEPVAPAGIEDLVVVNADTTEIRLAWTATGDDQRVGRAKEYDLRRSASPITTENAFAAAIRINGLPAPRTSAQLDSFTVTGLLPATDYYFAIKAADDVPLWSPLSNTPRGTTTPLPPAAPQGLAAEALSDTAIRLHWIDWATNETRYRIERQSPTDRQFVLAATMIGSFSGVVEYRDGKLTERTSYRYRVRAENAGGNSAWSSEVVQRTGIARPTNLTAAAVAPDSVALTWSFPLPNPTNGFRLERRSVSAGFVEVGRAAPADRAFGDGGLEPLTTYAYRLRAVDGRDVSDPSDSVEVTTPDLLPVCAVDPPTLAFGTVLSGSWVEQTFTISNTGGGILSGSVVVSCKAFSVVSGGGEFALGAGQTQEVTIRFTPTSLGDVQCTITPTGGCSSVTCSGTGDALPLCSVSPTSLDFGTVTLGRFEDRTITITNIGGGTLSGTVATAIGCYYYSILTGDGAFSLAAGQAHVVTVRFAPVSIRSAVCNVTLGTSSGCSSVSCIGTGEPTAACSVSPDTLDFGTQPVGSLVDSTFTVTNTGGGTLTGNIAVDCDGFAVISGGGDFALAAGSTRDVTIGFSPTSPGAALCTITPTGDCPAVLVSGTGEALPVCSVFPMWIDFATVPVGASADQTFTITNTGGGTLSGNVEIDRSGYSIITGSGAFSLGAGDSLVVWIRFAPLVADAQECRVTLGAADCPPVLCAGIGLAVPVCSIEPTSLDFGTVPIDTDADQTFTIRNTGGGMLSGTVGTNCNVYSVITGNGDFLLGADDSLVVTIRFTPQVELTAACTVTLGNDLCTDVVCSGAGQGPLCVVSPNSLDFGSIQVGERPTQTFTVTNVGGGHLTGSVPPTLPGSSFALDAGQGAFDLVHDGVHSVTVAYVPWYAGDHDFQIETGTDCTGSGMGPVIGVGHASGWGMGFANNAPDGIVNTLAVDGSNLAVGGTFSAIVGYPPAMSMAWWTGSAWITTIRDWPIWARVDVLHEWQGHGLVIAGQAFDFPGILATQTLADGTWEPLEWPIEGGAVKTLATWQTDLFVGGEFTTPVAFLGRWNQPFWEATNNGLIASGVNDLESLDGALYCATTASATDPSRGGAIYRWDGGFWTYLVDTINSVPLTSILKLATHNGALYAIVENGDGSYVARLQGATLVQVGKAAAGSYFVDLASDGTQLYVVGSFDGIDGVPAARVAAWDGSTWHALGSGLSGGPARPNVILPFDGSIYVGGNFTFAGGIPSPYIARWIP